MVEGEAILHQMISFAQSLLSQVTIVPIMKLLDLANKVQGF